MSEVSVIIPTYNGRETIGQTLEALAKQSFTDFETIVVVDGSTDGTTTFLEGRDWKLNNLVILEQRNQGRAIVRNNGVKAAMGKYLIFFDDDMIPSENCVRAHYSYLQKYQEGFQTGKTIPIVTDKTNDFQHYLLVQAEKWFIDACTQSKQDRIYLSAANLSTTKKNFEALNGFDIRLRDAEDFDLAMRASRKSINLNIVKEATAIHNDNYSCRSYILRQREYYKSRRDLHQLRGYDILDQKASTLSKFFYKVMARKFWVELIDKNRLWFVPLVLRYKLYDVVIASLSSHHPSEEI